MGLWEEKFLKTLKKLGISVDMYKRYVDDITGVCPPINAGWKYCTEKKTMIYSVDTARTDTNYPAIRTAKILNMIANTLESDIQLSFDVLELHDEKRIPVLVLKIWATDNVVKHIFYKMQVSS